MFLGQGPGGRALLGLNDRSDTQGGNVKCFGNVRARSPNCNRGGDRPRRANKPDQESLSHGVHANVIGDASHQRDWDRLLCRISEQRNLGVLDKLQSCRRQLTRMFGTHR